jgi:hypothetical protein
VNSAVGRSDELDSVDAVLRDRVDSRRIATNSAPRHRNAEQLSRRIVDLDSLTLAHARRARESDDPVS